MRGVSFLTMKLLEREDYKNYYHSSRVSDVGQSVKEEPKVQKKLTASDVAFETVLALDTNGISKEEFLVALKEQLELIEDNIQLDEVA